MTTFGLKGQRDDPEETDPETRGAGSLDAWTSPPATFDAQNRLRAIIEQQPACLAEVTADGRVLAMNEAQVALMGSHGGGRSYHDLVSLTDRERVADFIRQVTEGEPGSLEYLLVGPGAKACDVVTDAVPLDRGSEHGVVAVMVTRDLTAYRSLEDHIQTQADDHVTTCAELRAQLQAVEKREQALLAQRDAERQRVGQALERARVQLVELKDLRNQSATPGGGVAGGLAVSPAHGRDHAAAGA